MARLLIVGGASIDILHLAGRTERSAGGAGMYTAMAARRCGVEVSLFAPRPSVIPEELQPIARRLEDWLGPEVAPESFPRFEISYLDGTTRYNHVNLDQEASLDPSLLPADLSAYDLVHLIPLGDATLQLSFLKACRQRDARLISASTGLFIVEKQAAVVRQIVGESDYFFMNRSEAEQIASLDGPLETRPGQVFFVTDGAENIEISRGNTKDHIPVTPAREVDPTGAGDTFCGATLAFLTQNEHPVMAARKAALLAGEMIGQVGPAALLVDNPPPGPSLDPRMRVNEGQIRKVAARISTMSEVTPFPFTGPTFPRAGHPMALGYFFTVTLQQFSFWLIRENHYNRPLLAPLGGQQLKGSDYAFLAYTRKLDQDPEFFTPARQANLTREELLDLFKADDGTDPMPALDEHLEMARRYGQDMLALNLSPESLLHEALSTTDPLTYFQAILGKISGYREDPLRKKSTLLAMILNQRPEKFLPLLPGTQLAPVIDYHLMRSCLRIGLIDVLDSSLRERLSRREIVASDEEWAIRFAAYQAVEKLVKLSGKSTGAVDYYFFGARRRCPEMTEPECWHCQVDPVCAHRKELFQPVLRTTFY